MPDVAVVGFGAGNTVPMKIRELSKKLIDSPPHSSERSGGLQTVAHECIEAMGLNHPGFPLASGQNSVVERTENEEDCAVLR